MQFGVSYLYCIVTSLQCRCIHFNCMVFSHRNHAWVSFQGFCEAYNDAFEIERHLGEFVHM